MTDGAGRPERALDRLCEALTEFPPGVAARYDAHLLLDHVAPLVSRSAYGPARREAAERVVVTPPAAVAAVGSVIFPAVGSRGARMVRVWARMIADGPDRVVPADLPAPTQSAIDDALHAARELLGETQGDPKIFEVVVETPVVGTSLGLAVGLAALSCARRAPVPERLVATGALRRDGGVRRVDDVPGKRALLLDALPEAQMLVPQGQDDGDPRLLPVASLRQASDFIGIASKGDLNQDVSRVMEAFQGGDWVDASRRALCMLDEVGLYEEERLSLRLVLLAAANHRGEGARAGELAAELAAGLRGQGPLSPGLAAQALATIAIASVDALRATEAGAVLDQAEALSLRPEDPAWVHLRGARAVIAILAGDLDRALTLRQDNALRCRPDERPRCLGDLADVHLRRGEIAAARAAMEEALCALGAVSGRRAAYLRVTGQYLHLHASRIARAEGDLARARAELDLAEVEPNPGFRCQCAMERALLEPHRVEHIRAIEASCAAAEGARMMHALRLRARYLAGDEVSLYELAECLGA